MRYKSESDDDGVDMGPPKMTLVENGESLKGIANFVAQNACLGDEDLLQVQRLANKYRQCKQQVL